MTRQMQNQPSRLLLTPVEAARALSISVGTLSSMTKRGAIPHVPIGRRLVRYAYSDLEAYIERYRQNAADSRLIEPPVIGNMGA